MVSDAYRFGLPPLALGVLALVLRWPWAGVILIFLAGLIFFFFRDPRRVVPSDPDAVVSPADGRVVEIVEEALGGKSGRRISIFLSLWDVHVNRAPVAGRIRHVEYRPGRFYAALRSRASAENEQNVIRIESPRGELVLKQIAGWIARRVQCWKAEGDEVRLGERLGIIRFGSRVDVWLPAEAELLVRRGQHVAGGATVLARWPFTN